MTNSRRFEASDLVLYLALVVVFLWGWRRGHDGTEAAEPAPATEAAEARLLRSILPALRLPVDVAGAGTLSDGSLLKLDFTSLSKSTVLAVVNPDCEGCATELPILDALWRREQCDGLALYGIALGPSARVSSYVDSLGLSFPIVYGWTGSVWDVLPLNVSPSAFLLNTEGSVASALIGASTEATREEFAEALRRQC